MTQLRPMPAIVLPAAKIQSICQGWSAASATLSKSSGEKIGRLCDQAVSAALAEMLGGIKVCPPKSKTALLPPAPDCVEMGPARIIGGIRAQDFDVVYRPDGVRFAYDSKTLNTKKSIGKNYRNMINDLGTEATTVHTRSPWSVVAFLFAVPIPCLGSHRAGLLGALYQLAGRSSPHGDLYKAEAIAILAYDPTTGMVDPSWPPAGMAKLRLEQFSDQVQSAYFQRFAGLPPHV